MKWIDLWTLSRFPTDYVWHSQLFPLTNWQMWSHFASSVTINYIGKKERPFWGLTSGKEKCYWPVKSYQQSEKPDSVCYSMLSSEGPFGWQVWGAHLLSIFLPLSFACSKEKLAILEKPVCNYIPSSSYSSNQKYLQPDQTLPTNKDKCAMYSITAKYLCQNFWLFQVQLDGKKIFALWDIS